MSSKLDIVTGRMSKLMLKRWSMLAEQCSEEDCHTPLMGDPKTGEPKCVWHHAQELFPDEVTETVVAEQEQAPDNTLLKERRKQGDQASELIAKCMLEGWAMTDRTCQNETCYNIPLVQDRDRVRLCVICKRKYMDESDYNSKYGSKKTETVDNEPKIKETSAKVSKVEERSGSLEQSAVVAALETKMHTLASQLATTTDPEDICRIAKAIKECAKAMKECQKT